MKRLIIIAAFISSGFTAKAQLVSSVDTVHFRPIIDTSVKGFASCKIRSINLPLSSDSVTRISLKVVSDNLQTYSDIDILFLNDSLQSLNSMFFTLQDDALPVHLIKNYTDVQNKGVEYLFQVIATYLYDNYHFRLIFK